MISLASQPNPWSKLGMSKSELVMALENLDNDIHTAASLICNSMHALAPDELIDNQQSIKARSLAAQRVNLALSKLHACSDRIQSIRARLDLPAATATPGGKYDDYTG